MANYSKFARYKWWFSIVILVYQRAILSQGDSIHQADCHPNCPEVLVPCACWALLPAWSDAAVAFRSTRRCTRGSWARRDGKAGWWFRTWLLFSHILKIIIPIDWYFSEGFKPPTSSTRWFSIFRSKQANSRKRPEDRLAVIRSFNETAQDACESYGASCNVGWPRCWFH